MAIINLGEFKGFSLIPEGWHEFKITKVDYDEKFGKMEIELVTKNGQKHTERFTLLDNTGEINQKAINAFSFFARVAMNNFQIDSLDHETLFTINKFFENNLNVSETSRKLFVHRNTLVYRLEKIKKLTGLDLREFDNAIVLKVALMVKQYLRSRENFN